MNENNVVVKKRKWPYILLAIVLVFAIIIGIACVFVESMLSYNYKEIDSKPEILGFETVKDDRIINIALFGLDTRSVDSFSGRSDTIMILSVNNATGKVKVISVMRDSLVPIDKQYGRTFNKINSAYSTGGPELAIKTLNTMFDLDISEYVSINFFKLAQVIDLVGGVEIEIVDNEISQLNGCTVEICMGLGKDSEDYKITKAGKQHLNGIQAVAFSRIRYTSNVLGTNNDYGRTDRQRMVMGQLFKKALAMPKSEYLKLVKPILSSCESSLTYMEVVDVAINVLSNNSGFSEARVPMTEYIMPSPNAGVGSVVYFDINYAAKMINAFIYDDIAPKNYIEKNGVEKYDWYNKGFKAPKISHEEKGE